MILTLILGLISRKIFGRRAPNLLAFRLIQSAFSYMIYKRFDVKYAQAESPLST